MPSHNIIITDAGRFEFIGTFLRNAEKPNWHYYLVEEDGEFARGTRLHFRKDKLIAVIETPLPGGELPPLTK